jgi:hypothetical protein
MRQRGCDKGDGSRCRKSYIQIKKGGFVPGVGRPAFCDTGDGSRCRTL